MPSSVLGNISSLSLHGSFSGVVSSGPPSPSLVDNLIGKAESLAGHPGHGLLQGKPRGKTTIYHPAAHMMMGGGGPMGSMGMGMGLGMNASSLPYPAQYGKKGK